MGIENFELYSEKLNNILDEVDDFCESIECESSIAMKKGEKIQKLRRLLIKLNKLKQVKRTKKKLPEKKLMFFFTCMLLVFCRLTKLSGEVPISQKILPNMIAIHKN